MGMKNNKSAQEDIDHYKEFNRTIHSINKNTKQDYCEICLKKCDSLCNSHSIPQFILKNITSDGRLYSASGLVMNYPKSFENYHIRGVSNSGTFKLICKDCDNHIFKEYENEMNLRNVNSKVCLEIVLKNILKDMYSKIYVRESNNWTLLNHNLELPNYEACEYDYIELKKSLRRVLKGLKGKLNISYKILFNEILDYVTPIAYQGEIVLNYDLEGHLINDTIDFDVKHRTEGLNLVVFPFKSQSLVLMFYDECNRKMKSFEAQFLKKSFEEKLEILNYIIFRFTDAYYIEKNTALKIKKNKNLIAITQILDLFYDDIEGRREERKRRKYELKNRLEIPNLLLKEWALTFTHQPN